MRDQKGLIVRQARRHEIALPASVAIADTGAGAVRLGPGSNAADGWVEMDLSDIAAGGVGLVGTQYLPRGARIVVRVYPLEGRHAEPLFECPARVMRVQMTDGRPGYMLGTAFVGATEESRERVSALLDAMEEEAA